MSGVPGGAPQTDGGAEPGAPALRQMPVSRKISESTIRRLSVYLRSLEELEEEGRETVSSEELARRGITTAAQVRKDLSHFGSFGKRGLGYTVSELAERLRDILGLDREWRVALVGAGRLGSALFEYEGFARRGFRIVAVVDADPAKVGGRWGDVTIRPDEELEDAVVEEDVEMAILAVPGDVAQEVADRVVDAGVRAILNFAPVHLRLPEEVSLKDVNLVVELEALSFVLSRNEEA